VNRALAEAVVSCLRVSGQDRDFHALSRFSTRDWRRTYHWLDNAGLTLYLLQRLKHLDTLRVLPAEVLARLERNLTDNRTRVDQLIVETGRLSARFEREGVRHAVIKGLSLAPEFCPDPYLRSQCDVDFLVDRQSLAPAQRVLEECGYGATNSSEVQFSYERPLQRVPSKLDDPYNVRTAPTVELHLAMWDNGTHQVPFMEPEFSLNGLKVQKLGEVSFPALHDEDVFVLQVLHVFQHLLACWVKMSWLFEISYFLERRWTDSIFWSRLDERIRFVPRLTEFSAIVLGLATQVFSPHIPDGAKAWGRSLSPAAMTWLNNYGRSWAFGDRPLHESTLFPDAKVSLFLHREYLPDPEIRRSVMRRYLLPYSRPSTIARPLKNKPATRLPAYWRQGTFVLQRLMFHLGSGLRYLWELPRWRGLNRMTSRLSDGAP
jgi:hypothetical protein